MFKQLKNYYIVVALPFVLLLGGSGYFLDQIRGTITRNPHPQINYTIFYIILFGGALIIYSTFRLMKEAKHVTEYSRAIQENIDPASLQHITNEYDGDIACLLQMLSTTMGRQITHQEQAALEHELVNARARLVRRNALPQYLSGLLVGMGLLGTFIGLLSTLHDISVLISSFGELDVATANPLQVFRIMIDRMKAPMQSMGIAFSASMFGLLGSIVLGLMMLGIRRMQGDISSLLSSHVARHVEIALSFGSDENVVSGNKEVVVHGQSVNVALENAVVRSDEEFKVFARIEEILAESLRLQQESFQAGMDEFQRQHLEMLGMLIEQAKMNNDSLARLGARLESLDALAVQARAGNECLEKIDDRLGVALLVQQKALAFEMEDAQKQRADMLRTLTEQIEAHNRYRSDLQELARQVDGRG